MTLLERVKQIDIRMVMQDLGYQLIQNRRMKCPFHEEDTASLHVYPSPQNEFHCFGCDKHGDVINFYAEANKIDFKTALDRLAYTYLPDLRPHGMKAFNVANAPILYTPAEPEKAYRYDVAHSEIYEALLDFCKTSSKTPTYEQGLNYLIDRGLSEWLIRNFKISIIPNYQAANAFLKYNFPEELLRASGLVNDKGNLVFWVHPILIPYTEKGRVVFLQGRAIAEPPPGSAKYQFLKGVPRTLFNVDLLASQKRATTVHITEGAFDCLAIVQAGRVAVAAGSAQHFKAEWLKWFKKHETHIWFDNDAAGQKGAIQLQKLFEEKGLIAEIKQVPPPFKDLNEYLNPTA